MKSLILAGAIAMLAVTAHGRTITYEFYSGLVPAVGNKHPDAWSYKSEQFKIVLDDQVGDLKHWRPVHSDEEFMYGATMSIATAYGAGGSDTYINANFWSLTSYNSVVNITIDRNFNLVSWQVGEFENYLVQTMSVSGSTLYEMLDTETNRYQAYHTDRPATVVRTIEGEDLPPAPVPLPASAALLIGALGALGVFRNRRFAD